MQELEQLKLSGRCPNFMNEESLQTIKRGYLLANETPIGLYKRLARGASNYLGDSFFEPLCKLLLQGYFSPSTPVAANFNAPKEAKRGLPVSCFGSTPGNSIFSIYQKAQELALLSKAGGGVSIDVDDLIGPTTAAEWARIYDNVFSTVSQGATRRGSGVVSINYNHPDLLDILNAKDLLAGADSRQTLSCNIAVAFDDADLERIFSSPTEADLKAMAKIAHLRMSFGSPYIVYNDNIKKALPECYEANNLSFRHTNLCAEIMLHSDEDHTYVCVLSSLVLSRLEEYANVSKHSVSFNEIANIDGLSWTAPMLAIAFLDSVCQEFIDKASNIKGLECAVRSAEKGRPLGLGVLGWHTLLQKLGLPFDCEQSSALNIAIFKELRSEAEKATKYLAETKGEPEWCKGFGRRNTHLLALAPTMSNSVLCNGGSASIEPIKSNLYSFEGAKGIFVRKNEQLDKVLSGYGFNKEWAWKVIANNNGSVATLALSLDDQAIFKTAMEISQEAIIRQAIDRQAYIDQGQSLNLFLAPDIAPEQFWRLHWLAWKGGLKSLYYVRSKSLLIQDTTMVPSTEANVAQLKTRPDCSWCIKTKALLNKHNIAYEEQVKPSGPVPEILFRGHKLNYTSLLAMLEPQVASEETGCSACEG